MLHSFKMEKKERYLVAFFSKDAHPLHPNNVVLWPFLKDSIFRLVSDPQSDFISLQSAILLAEMAIFVLHFAEMYASVSGYCALSNVSRTPFTLSLQIRLFLSEFVAFFCLPGNVPLLKKRHFVKTMESDCPEELLKP